MLKELGVTLMGEALCILKQAKEDSTELQPGTYQAVNAGKIKLMMKLSSSG